MVMKSTITLQFTNGTNALRLASFSLNWASVPGKTYQVETSQSLLTNQWSDIGDPVTATATTSAQAVTLAPADERRFYRVKVVP